MILNPINRLLPMAVLLAALARPSLVQAQLPEGAAQCSKGRQTSWKAQAKGTTLSDAELNYDVKYVKLDLSLNNMNTQIAGSATTKATVINGPMSSYAFELDQVMVIDSMRLNGGLVTPSGTGTLRTVLLVTALTAGSPFTAVVYYHGEAPPTVGNFPKGLNNMISPTWGNHITFTLSEPYAANDWWPCKQALPDKIDSSDVWMTVPDSLMAGSNGVLTNVTTLSGNRKRYEWHNNRSIDYYLISMAAAGYVDYTYNQTLSGTGHVVSVKNYVYNNPGTLPFWQARIDSVGGMIDFLSDRFGEYPYWQQKYGHCMAPLGGGMEHQTMTTLGTFETGLTVHELGHQWWGDHVTCGSWKDIWLNEGFASYCEYLYIANFQGAVPAYQHMEDVHGNVKSAAGGTVYCPDTTDENRIFDGRLTYNKGSAAIHTMRHWINDDNKFFQGLRDYQSNRGDGVAFTTDLEADMEVSTGVALDTFFSQWVFGEGYPTYSAEWNQIGSTVYVALSQTTSVPASVPFFYGPLELRLQQTSGNDTTVRIYHHANGETYSFQWNGSMDGLSIDPGDWIISSAGAITHNSSLAAGSVSRDAARIFPNPTSNAWTVGGLQGHTSLTLLDAVGRVLWQGATDGAPVNIPAQALLPGAYLLRIASGSGTAVRKLLKQ